MPSLARLAVLLLSCAPAAAAPMARPLPRVRAAPAPVRLAPARPALRAPAAFGRAALPRGLRLLPLPRSGPADSAEGSPWTAARAAAWDEAAPRAAVPDALGDLRGLEAAKADERSARRDSFFDRSAPAAESSPEASAAPAPLDPGHWSGSRIADARYGRLLADGAARLAEVLGADALRPDLLEEVHRAEPKLHSHMMRVGLLSGLIALRLGMAPGEVLEAVWGGRLHDVGKLGPGIMSAINKPGALEPDERRAMENHAALGAELIFRQEDIPPALRIPAMQAALGHHEKWDGAGYPQRLRGADIPRLARVVGLADYLDALMEHRPYRGGLTLGEATLLLEQARAGFDPEMFPLLDDIASPYNLH